MKTVSGSADSLVLCLYHSIDWSVQLVGSLQERQADDEEVF